MRPQHIAAENPVRRRQLERQLRASMRPQHIAAENPPEPHQPAAGFAGFNEAAAYSCGKRRAAVVAVARIPAASMRPQHIAAENIASSPPRSASTSASMRPQHIAAENVSSGQGRADVGGASMRPQHIAAENRVTDVDIGFWRALQ